MKKIICALLLICSALHANHFSACSEQYKELAMMAVVTSIEDYIEGWEKHPESAEEYRHLIQCELENLRYILILENL